MQRRVTIGAVIGRPLPDYLEFYTASDMGSSENCGSVFLGVDYTLTGVLVTARAPRHGSIAVVGVAESLAGCGQEAFSAAPLTSM